MYGLAVMQTISNFTLMSLINKIPNSLNTIFEKRGLLPCPSGGPKRFWLVQFVLDGSNSFWSVQTILEGSKSLDTRLKCFGPTKINWIRPKQIGPTKIVLAL